MRRTTMVSAIAIGVAALAACDAARNHGAAAQPEPAAADRRAEPPAESTPVPAAEPAETPRVPAAEPTPAPAAQRTAEAPAAVVRSGKLKFNNYCRTCHSMREGDHRLGPSLHGVVGRKAGTAPGYASYSQALRNSGIVWNEETLDEFLTKPDALVPGNNMKPFAGIPDPQVRREIIAHLKAAAEESAAAD